MRKNIILGIILLFLTVALTSCGKKYTVTFDTQGGTAIESVEVKKKKTIQKPTDPTKEGYTFVEWLLEGETFDFNTKITEDITLIAKWNQNNDPDNGGGTEPNDTTVNYSVIITDTAGKPLSDFYVIFYLGKDVIAEGYTNNQGTFTKDLSPNKYDVILEEPESGAYYLNKTEYQTDLVGTPIEVTSSLGSLAGVEADLSNSYELGDLMYDFTVVDTAGNELTLYELLEEYKAVVLNFWYTTCSYCNLEFPYMIDAYESSYTDANNDQKFYREDVAIIAINPGTAGNGDSLQDIIDYKESMGISFHVALDYDGDTSNMTADPALTTMFAIGGYPTTVVIDRYGLIAYIEEGAITTKEKWSQTFDKYIADDYSPVYTGTTEDQIFVKPDIVQEDSSILEAAVNGINYDGTKFSGQYKPEYRDSDKEFSWPWVVGEYDGKSCIKPSNSKVDSSFSIVYIDVTLKAGEAFTFDYYSSTEEYDILYIIVNDTIATSIAGQSSEWEKSYAYVAVEDGDYEIGFCYIKDGSIGLGDDSVYIDNIRIVEEEDIDKETYIFRDAATGDINQVTMRYDNYIEAVYNEEDGYYHVGTENGPLLLADMLSGSKWSNDKLYEICIEGKCIGADGEDYNKIIEEYSIYASNSEVGYCPVTMELANALKQIVKELGDDAAENNQNQWLELCVYYSAYGTNNVELGLPTNGVCYFEPIEFEGNGIENPATAEATFDRIILPRGFIFAFTPEESGVYKFYSVEEIETIGWICDDKANVIGNQDAELRIFAEQSSYGIEVDCNFVLHAYLEAGNQYLFRAAFYDVSEYSTISVEIKYLAETMELLTIASPGFFTSSDDEMADIISGNYVDVELDSEGYYQVKDSSAVDKSLYCDIKYINNITGYSLETCLSDRFKGFDFSKDEYNQPIFDEEGYYRIYEYDEEGNSVSYYVCYDIENNYYYVETIGQDGYTEENGYTYVRKTEGSELPLAFTDCTEYVKQYIEDNMITDENSELYGCVKVDEKFAEVLGYFMDKYTFAGVEYSWVKLCYYYRHLGPTLAE